MSTLAAARADNFYYPPGWDPSKGSLNKFQGSHGALGDRARKLDQGILIIRFEMPFNVWCLGCNHLIGKGVRFNAEKKQVGAYHSTKIWSFRMRTPCCQTEVEVRTDPKNAEYIIVSGARRKEESYGAEEAGTVELDTEAAHLALADPLARLEHEQGDKQRAAAAHAELTALHADSQAKHRDDYAMNKQLRQRMRGVRKEEKARDARRQALGLPEHVKLLPETAGDRLRASAVQFGGNEKWQKNRQHARREIKESSIFSPAAVAAAPQGRKRSSSSTATAPPGGSSAALVQKRRRLDPAVKLGLTAAGGGVVIKKQRD